jgi:hypothetical protein
MKCPKCQFDNREGAKFCGECGHKFEITCPSCGTNNPAGNKFCDECGSKIRLALQQLPKNLSLDAKIAKIQKYLPEGLTEKILAQRDRIEGERKQVTVMFCDMEGFTPLSKLLDNRKHWLYSTHPPLNPLQRQRTQAMKIVSRGLLPYLHL